MHRADGFQQANEKPRGLTQDQQKMNKKTDNSQNSGEQRIFLSRLTPKVSPNRPNKTQFSTIFIPGSCPLSLNTKISIHQCFLHMLIAIFCLCLMYLIYTFRNPE